ncbi:MAG: abortive infection family protein [Candidatus Acidiferrales bacterium]
MALNQGKPASAPLTDAVIAALARLVDDSQSPTGSRQPSHSEIEEQFRRADLMQADQNQFGRPIGKAKRIRRVLHWAIENEIEKGEKLVYLLVALVQGVGGFREGSSNFVGGDAIQDLREAFAIEGFSLTENGELLPVILDTLSGPNLTEALKAYVRRARRGVLDAALITGTGKDLVEAVAAHVLVERFGNYSQSANFPTLLGQAFVAVGLCAMTKSSPTAQEQMELSLYDLACAVNRLRNREGTGHGRPFLPTVTETQSRTAVQSMGLVAALLLDTL